MAAAPSAAVGQAPAAPCPIAFIGMHGLNETHYTSKTIHSVWDEYWRKLPASTRLRDPVFLGYPQRSGREFYDRFRHGTPAADDPVEEAFGYLTKQANSTVRQCRPARLVLVGYSAGAWSIDKWLRARPDLHSQVLGVALFGDPQWDHGDQAQGLARRYGQAVSSPYVPESLSSRFQSWCASGDAVCGEGFGPGRHGFARQNSAAIRMLITGKCAEHCSYPDGATRRAAEFLARLSTR